MKSFQLDENFNDRRLVEQCTAAGRCELLRFPPKLRGVADEIWMPDLLTKTAPVVTKDFRIVEQHREAVPPQNSGIIIVRPKKARPSFTSKQAVAIIANFKSRFPSWADTDWSGIYTEITEIDVYVTALTSGDLDNGRTLELARLGFVEDLTAALVEIRLSARRALPG